MRVDPVSAEADAQRPAPSQAVAAAMTAAMA
jgi:hypothetical protein